MFSAKTELCIFDSTTPQIVVENGSFEEIFPLNSISGYDATNEIEFRISGTTSDYLDLNDTLLFVQVQVRKGEPYDPETGMTLREGKTLTKDVVDDVVPVNYMFHSLFKDVSLYFNNVKIEGGTDTYSHKALLESIISYTDETKRMNLTSIGYDENVNERQKWIANERKFDMCGSLQLDFLDQPKYLIPGVDVILKLKRNNFESSIISSNYKPQININAATLLVRRVKVDKAVSIGHQIGLKTKNAIYPYRKAEMNAHSINVGAKTFYKENLFQDYRLPKFVLISFKTTDNYTGKYKNDSTSFGHFNISSITLSRYSEYREAYTQDFKTDNYTTSYVTSMIRNMGYLDKNLNNGITLAKFKSDCPFFTFVLAPDFDINQAQVPKQGNLRLDVRFDDVLKEGVTMMVYGIFDHDIQINNERVVLA